MAVPEPLTKFAQKYKIHEETIEYVRQSLLAPLPSFRELSVEKSREILNSSMSLNSDVTFDGEETEIFVPSPHTSEGIPISVYKPSSQPEVPAILVYFHGGGLIFCSRKTHEPALKILARDSGAIIVNVEYRLLPDPDAPYAPFDDAEVVTRWVLENKEAVGGKSTSKVGVGGDSSGGNITIGVTNEIRGLDFQILIYPVADTAMKNETFKEFSDAPLLTKDGLLFAFENSIYHMPDYLTNPRINGMARTNTELSPPALIILAELDLLRGCGEDYADKLRAAGVKVQLEIIKGVPHGFFTLGNFFKTTSAQAYDHIVKYLKQFL